MTVTARKILHADIDAFYASVEQIDNPALADVPVIVGADPKGGRGRGVVSACSYEARRFGVHSAMPISKAWRLCPGGAFLKPRFDRYVELSERVFSIFNRYTDLVEPLSVDEAFLDLTGAERLFGPAPELARDLKGAVLKETGLVISMGIAPNKFLAKMASEQGKPDGFIVVGDDEVESFLWPLHVSKLWGVGPKTCERLARRGIVSVGDLANAGIAGLKASFGKAGEDLFRLARGIDERPVCSESKRKSIGAETTFSEDTNDSEVLRYTLLSLSDDVSRRLRRAGVRARSVTLKWRDEDFSTCTRSSRLPLASDIGEEIFATALELMKRVPDASAKVRLLGITAGNLTTSALVQLELFTPYERDKDRRLETTLDVIKERFGSASIVRAAFLSKRPDGDKD